MNFTVLLLYTCRVTVLLSSSPMELVLLARDTVYTDTVSYRNITVPTPLYSKVVR